MKVDVTVEVTPAVIHAEYYKIALASTRCRLSKFYCLINEGQNDGADGDGANLRPTLIIQNYLSQTIQDDVKTIKKLAL
jgi:hypothetical protein